MQISPQPSSQEREDGKKADVEGIRDILSRFGNQYGWEQAWQQNLTPWESDMGNVPQPSLVWACEGGLESPAQLLPSGGKALVPGCGRGQDPLYLAGLGFSCTGIDISHKAVEEAKKWLKEQPSSPAKARVSLVVHDYFSVGDGTVSDDIDVYTEMDLVYDYTFFCALPPELHESWTRSHERTIKPGGKLLIVLYPLRPEGNTSNVGPPFFVSSEQYKRLLSANFILEYEGVPPNLPTHKVGKEMVQIWRRK